MRWGISAAPVQKAVEGDPDAIQSARDKLKKPRGKVCPAELPEEKAEEMRTLVRHAFQSLDLFDFARVDLRMDAKGNLYGSECLARPLKAEHSYFAKSLLIFCWL